MTLRSDPSYVDSNQTLSMSLINRVISKYSICWFDIAYLYGYGLVITMSEIICGSKRCEMSSSALYHDILKHVLKVQK